ncbi:hypothetical protein BRC86_10515 [Halobacteriales archaeon QS_3_64_16]|nr:MAG: hypothetical protein BRC86_10515 [Halobacteriales archaeon QS_3_64_16]
MLTPGARNDRRQPRNGFRKGGKRQDMGLSIDPVLVGLVVVMLVFVFGVYLLIRRTLLSLREGFESGKQ